MLKAVVEGPGRSLRGLDLWDTGLATHHCR